MTLVPPVQGNASSANDVNQVISVLNGTAVAIPGATLQIATTTVSTSIGFITFTNIPPYNTIYLSWQVRSTVAAATDVLAVQINFDSSTNYFNQRLAGTNTTTIVDSEQAINHLHVSDVAGASASASNMTGWGFATFLNWNANANALGFVSMGGCIKGTGAGGMIAGIYSGIYGVNGAAFTKITAYCAGGNIAGNVCPAIFTLYGSM